MTGAMDLTFYAAAIPAVILVGMSKGGFSGVGMLAMPVMALAMPPVEAAAIMLPILIIQDMVSVASYWRTWDARNLRLLLPGACIGVGLGYQFAASVPDAAVSLAVGFISVTFGFYRLVIERRGPIRSTPRGHGLLGFICGIGSGVTSMIVHAGGPPFQMFVMPQKLPHHTFVGTSVIFFSVMNLMKVPPYLLLGQLSARSLAVSLTLFPIAIASTLAGIWLVRRTSSDRFYTILYLLMIAIGIKLALGGACALLT
jgi:uncharacterized protein